MNTYYTYIMSCNTNSTIYVGVTNDINRRYNEHKYEALEGFTKKYKLHKLVYFEEYSDINEAIKREKQIKSWSRKKKDELINSVNPKWIDLMWNR